MASSWIDIQQNTFTRWVNEHLKDRGMYCENLGKDLCDGLLLINLLEIISNKKVGKYNKHPIIPAQKLENTLIAMKFIQSEGIKLVNIGNEDITFGRLKLILGLIWTLILRYQINKGRSGDDTGSAKSDLLKWVQSKIPEYNITGFQKDWNDGKAICALVDAISPGLCPGHKSMDSKNALANATTGIDIGYDRLGVPKLILPAEMNHPKVDEQAMMAYISYYRECALKLKDDSAQRCRAFGPGLVEGIVAQEAPFTVQTPPNAKGKLEVKVTGPKTSAKVNVTEKNGVYSVSYLPTEEGEYKISVTLGGEHIPGSIFTVTVLKELSLGGEGKIRIFYSTTSAKNEKTRPLQELLQSKKVHERPDFEPWIPVDVMETKDRDAVFKKAGTKNLPIVYIDDVFIGDAAKIFELNENGGLDKLLKVK